MRELKPRAWSKSHDAYCDFVTLDETGTWVGWFKRCGIYLADSDIVVELPTGLKDKNGKEIYEGDILGGIYEHGYIAYCDKCKQLQFFDADIGCMMCSGDIYWRDIVESERNGELAGELEVVGNIHENPELLEDK